MLMKKIFYYICLASLILASSCSKDDESDAAKPNNQTNQNENKEEEKDNLVVEQDPEALILCNPFGLYDKAFTLTIEKKNEQNTIYYTLDGSPADMTSAIFPKTGIFVKNSTKKSDYILTPNVAKIEDYGLVFNFTDFGYIEKGVCLSLVEYDKDGNEVARKRGTFIVSEKANQYKIPIVCLTMPKENWLGIDNRDGLYNRNYHQNNVDDKYRGYLEYYDPTTGKSFALESQFKRGGNWTRGEWQRSINCNFTKNDNGEKNPKPKFDIFYQPTMTGGSLKGEITRFRLHNGGNCSSANWNDMGTFFTDAYIQALIGNKANVGTTGYRPVLVYLNGEYWGIYTMREHNSDQYLNAHYGVKKSEVLFVERGWNEPNAGYGWEIQEGEYLDCKLAINELYEDLFGFNWDKNDIPYYNWDASGWEKTGKGTKYEKFCQLVDVNSFIDYILINAYIGNWDFMGNNFRMWKTKTVDPENPYADGKWRFLVHDVDFGFEHSDGNNRVTNKMYNYFDYYLGKTSLDGKSELPGPLHYLILYLPCHNSEFVKALKARMPFIKSLFESSSKLTEMKNEYAPYYQDRINRWNWVYYRYDTWDNALTRLAQKQKEKMKIIDQQIIDALNRL